MKTDEFYLFVNSNDSDELFTANTYSDFKIQLPNQIELGIADRDNFVWQVALVEVSITDPPQTLPELMVIQADNVQNSYYKNSYRQILRVLRSDKITTASLFGPMYVNLLRESFRTVHFKLFDQDYNPIDIKSVNTVLTLALHFQVVEKLT